MNKAFKYILILVSLLYGCSSDSGKAKKDSEIISISGAFALYPLTVIWKDEYCKIHPNIKIEVSAGGAGKGIADALSGIVTIGMVSRELSKSEIEKGAFALPVAKDAVIGIVNSYNPVIKTLNQSGLSRETLRKIFFTGLIKTWGEAIGNANLSHEGIQVYTRSDACGAADTWANFLGCKQEDLTGVGVFGDPGIVQSVQRDKFAIGFCNLSFAYNSSDFMLADNIRPVRIDLNNNGVIEPGENFYNNMREMNSAISNGKYPSPPARILYFVLNSKPENTAVRDFLKWVLTDGQRFITQNGYVKLDSKKINESIDQLK